MFNRITASFVILFALSGCASVHRDNTPIDQSVFSRPAKIVVAQISGFEKPEFYKTGAQGLLDLAISGATTNEVSTKIECIDPKPLIERHYYSPFTQAFQTKSMTVVKDLSPLQETQLKKSDSQDTKFAPYDFRELKEKHGAQYALVLDPKTFGTTRPYSGFVPLSVPSGHASIKIYLIRLEDNKLLGYYSGVHNIPVEEWDTPPEYHNLCDAVSEALKIVLDRGYAYLMRGR